MSHKQCPIKGCKSIVANRLLMCWTHWRRVPFQLRDQVVDTFRRDQERGPRPSLNYLALARLAIDSVNEWEGKNESKKDSRGDGVKPSRGPGIQHGDPSDHGSGDVHIGEARGAVK